MRFQAIASAAASPCRPVGLPPADTTRAAPVVLGFRVKGLLVYFRTRQPDSGAAVGTRRTHATVAALSGGLQESSYNMQRKMEDSGCAEQIAHVSMLTAHLKWCASLLCIATVLWPAPELDAPLTHMCMMRTAGAAVGRALRLQCASAAVLRHLLSAGATSCGGRPYTMKVNHGDVSAACDLCTGQTQNAPSVKCC